MADEPRITAWHLLAFLGEMILWGSAAWAGSTLTDGVWRWILGAAVFLVVIGIWSTLVGPKAKSRLTLKPRLGLIATLGVGIGLLFVPAAQWAGLVVAYAATAVVIIAAVRSDSHS